MLSRAFPKCLRGDEKRPWGRYPRRGFRPDVYISRRLGRCGQGLGASDPVRRYPTRTLAPTLRCVGSGPGSGSGAGFWFGSGSGAGRVPLAPYGGGDGAGGRPDRSWGWPAQQETGHRRGPKPGDVPFGSGVWRTSPKEADPTQRGWGYNPPNTCAMRIFATIATG